MTQNLAELITGTAIDPIQNLAAAQILFCEQIFGAQAAMLAGLTPQTRQPDRNERPSVSARRQDWVAN
jgi:hypothetical protein